MPVANVKSAWEDGNLVFRNVPDGDHICTIDGNNGRLVVESSIVAGAVCNMRKRFTIGQINAGAELLPAVPGFKYRLVNVKAIAYGGAVGAVTTVDVLGTQAASGVKLATFAQANLTQSTVLQPGATGVTVLADGASFAACDENKAITVGKTGSDATTATGVDIIVDYVLEAA